MPTVSDRGKKMPDSPIRKLGPLANKAKERGIKVYHLNIGQPDLPTPPEALAAIKNIDRTILEYTPSEGIFSFREKLAKYYHKFDIDVTVDDIIITSGGSEAVTFAFMSCLDPGDEIIVPEPAYANYEAFAIVAGAEIKSIAAKIEEGFALPPVEDFEKLITPKTKGIMIYTFFPTRCIVNFATPARPIFRPFIWKGLNKMWFWSIRFPNGTANAGFVSVL
jgi:aspartate aminotransferase